MARIEMSVGHRPSIPTGTFETKNPLTDEGFFDRIRCRKFWRWEEMMTPHEAREAILQGKSLEGVTIEGTLDLSGVPIEGDLILIEAHIKGCLRLEDATMEGKLFLGGVTIDGNLNLATRRGPKAIYVEPARAEVVHRAAPTVPIISFGVLATIPG